MQFRIVDVSSGRIICIKTIYILFFFSYHLLSPFLIPFAYILFQADHFATHLKEFFATFNKIFICRLLGFFGYLLHTFCRIKNSFVAGWIEDLQKCVKKQWKDILQFQ